LRPTAASTSMTSIFLKALTKGSVKHGKKKTAEKRKYAEDAGLYCGRG
jgi:hypothetical protein